MATKKTVSRKLPLRRLETFQDLNARGNRDSWNWRRMHGKLVVYGNSGFNSRSIAQKRAKRHAAELNFKIEVFAV